MSLLLHTNTFEGQIIWQQRIDLEAPEIALELRNPDLQETQFCLLELPSLLEANRFIPGENNWWSSLFHVYEGNIASHEFKDDQNPEIESLVVYNRDGEPSWRKDNIECVEAHQGTLECQEQSQQVLLDIRSGEPTDQTKKEVLVKGPHRYTEESEYFKEVSDFIKDTLEVEAKEAIEYAEWNNRIIISYYLYDDQNISNYLLIVDDQGEIELSLCLAEKQNGMGFDTFFTTTDYVIFTKEKNELCVIEDC